MKFILIVVGLVIILLLFKLIRRNPNLPKDSKLIKEDKTDNLNKTTAQKEKSKKTWGKFDVVGYHHLPEEVKQIVWKQLKVGDELSLIPDPSNPYDENAIKVMYKQSQIGWFPKDHSRKKEIFNSLISNKEVNVI